MLSLLKYLCLIAQCKQAIVKLALLPFGLTANQIPIIESSKTEASLVYKYMYNLLCVVHHVLLHEA